MFDLFMMIHEGKKVDVLDTMFREMRECVRLQKSLIYATLIQALLESVCRREDIDGTTYPVSMPKRDPNYRPPVPTEYVPPKKGRNQRAAARAVSTASASSSARAPHERGSTSALDTPATFMRHEKKTLFKTVANLFKMCESIQRNQVRDINRAKAGHRAYKAKSAEKKGVPIVYAPEDHDSEVSEVSFPMANWRFDDDDDASSAPPVV